VRIHVRAGAGGQGAARLGAAGGDGGDVLVVADDSRSDLASLLHMRRVRAGAGLAGAARVRGVKGQGVCVWWLP
jgi:GTPase involved in cell partitioning and DNA repair